MKLKDLLEVLDSSLYLSLWVDDSWLCDMKARTLCLNMFGNLLNYEVDSIHGSVKTDMMGESFAFVIINISNPED